MENLKREIRYYYGTVAEFCRSEKLNYASVSKALSSIKKESKSELLRRKMISILKVKKNDISSLH